MERDATEMRRQHLSGFRVAITPRGGHQWRYRKGRGSFLFPAASANLHCHEVPSSLLEGKELKVTTYNKKSCHIITVSRRKSSLGPSSMYHSPNATPHRVETTTATITTPTIIPSNTKKDHMQRLTYFNSVCTT